MPGPKVQSRVPEFRPVPPSVDNPSNVSRFIGALLDHNVPVHVTNVPLYDVLSNTVSISE